MKRIEEITLKRSVELASDYSENISSLTNLKHTKSQEKYDASKEIHQRQGDTFIV